MVEIDSDKLVEAIQKHPAFGTGTLSEAAQCHPDELQRLIARGESSPEFVEKIEGLLNTTFRKLPENEQTEDVPVKVENHVEQDVHKGEDGKPDNDLPAEPNETLPTEPPENGTSENEGGETSSSSVEIAHTVATNPPPPESDEKENELRALNYQLLARTRPILKIKRQFGTEGFDYRKMLEAEQNMKQPRKTLIAMLEKCIKENNGNSATNS